MSRKIAGGESGLRKTALLKKRAGKGRQKKIRGKCLEYLRILRYIGKQERAVDRLSGRAGTEQKVQEKETGISKQELLDTLRRALARELSESEVADNINYYWNYIEQQVASGKSEEQVLSELGDPRLIARTILQARSAKRGGGRSVLSKYRIYRG